MSFDPSSIESDLQNLRAAKLDEALLARLDACVANTWTELTPAEADFEASLRAIAPAAIRPALQNRLESIVATVPFPAQREISNRPAAQGRKWWAAAAAVALIGAVSAWMIPAPRNPQTAQNSPAQISPQLPDSLIPAGFNSDLRETRDHGVIWQSGHQAQRVLKVVYLERVTLKDAQGKTYQVEQPRIEYILTPQTAN